MLLILVVLSMVLAGCGATAEPAQPTQAPAEPTAEVVEPTAEVAELTEEPAEEPAGEPKVLYLGQTNPPKNFNTYIADYAYDSEAVFHVHCRLGQFAPDQTSQPYLATWDVSEDGKVYTFHLNEDALWHDGEPVTAKDVVYTFKLTASAESGSVYFDKVANVVGAQEYRDGQAEEIEGIKVLDDKTVEVSLINPSPSFVSVLHAFMIIVPEHILGSLPMSETVDAAYWRNPVGCGPYKFVEYVSDQYLLLEKFPEFFLGEPKIDQVYIRLGTWEAQEAAFEIGELDVVRVEPTEFERFEAMDGVELVRVDSYVSNLVLNNQSPFLGDVRVRKAIMYALDREAMVEGALLGFGRVAENCWVTPWTLSPNITTYEYDPDKARDLLAEAGWDGSVTYKVLLGTGRPDRERMTLILQQNLADVGITVEVETMEGGTALEMLSKGEGDMGIVGHGTMSLLPEAAINYVGAKSLPPEGSNYSFFVNEELTEALEQAIIQPNQEMAQEYFWTATEISTDQLPYVHLTVQQDIVAVNTNRVSLPSLDPIPRNRPGGDINFITWDLVNWDIIE
jgi:peptide/nickel transport system substrate-binding protein